MLVLFIAAAIAQQPARDKALLHPHVEQIVAEKEQEQEQALRRLLSLGGSAEEQAEVTARLAAVLRARGLSLSIRAQAEADQGDEVSAGRDRATVAAVRAEAIARYRELLKKYPAAPRLDEALFFLADILQDSSRDQEAVAAARELVKKYPRPPATSFSVSISSTRPNWPRRCTSIAPPPKCPETRSIPTRSTRRPGAGSIKAPSSTP